MKNFSIFCILFYTCILFPFSIQAQKDGVIGSVGSQNVMYSELISNFSDGNNAEYSITDLQAYLPLYLDYKAKLLFAEDNGYFSDSIIVQEHSMYSKQAAYAHWLNNEIRPTLFQEFYNRAQIELKSFHILIVPPENPSSRQEQQIIQRLRDAKKEIEQGALLEEVDKKYSSVRDGRSVGGELPWISAGVLVKDFEDQMVALEPGEISEPFKTQFGYHIVLLQDVRERNPAISLSHIFVRPTNDDAALNKINDAYAALETGGAWKDVVLNFTEDGASARNSGKLGWISSHSNFATDFLEQINQLDPTLPYSEPINTRYGYHIFKVDSVQTFENEDQKKQVLKREFEKGSYFQENNAFAVDYLIKHYGSEPDESLIEKYERYIASFDTAPINSIKLTDDLGSETFLRFNDASFTLNDVHTYMAENHGEIPASAFNERLLSEFGQSVVDNTVIEFTLQKYPDFAPQVESYLNGLVIYKVNDDYLWSAETVDSTRLHNIYQNEIENYTLPDRPHFYMLSARHDSLLIQATNFINEGNSPDSIRNEMNRVFVNSDSLNAFTDEPFQRLQDMEPNTFSEIFEYNNRQTILYLKDHLPARNMTFEESFSRLLTEFQPTREEEWINLIRNKYQVKANNDNLRKLHRDNN